MEEPIRIIHFDTNTEDVERIIHDAGNLKISFEIYHVADRKEYLDALGRRHPDIVLSALSLPGLTVEEAQKMLLEKNSAALFILLVSAAEEKEAAALVETGADDYIIRETYYRLPVVMRRAARKMAMITDNRLHAAELESRELRFRALLENSYESILLTDEHLNILYRTPSASKITGFSSEELRNISLFTHIHPEDEKKFSDFIRKVRSTEGTPNYLTLRARHKNGNYIWIEATATNFLNNNNVKALVINYRDVTENKRTEERLLQAGKHFKALLENISDAIILLDRDGNIFYQSPSVERTTGFMPDNMHQQSIFSFLHPGDRVRAKEFFNSQLENNSELPEAQTFRMIHAGGGYIWVEGTLTNLLADASVNAMIINFHDITARKKSEQMLRKSEANLRTIFENTNVAYILIDKNFSIISFNHLARKRYQQEMNLKLKEGHNMIDLMPEHRKNETTSNFNRILAGEKISYEISFKQTNGETNWYAVDILPVRDNMNKVLGLIISSEDITLRKHIEIERDKMTEDIMKHNKNLEQFAYIISHNLRSPVANIIGLTNLLSGATPLNHMDFHKCISGLQTTARKLDEIISDLNFVLQKRSEVKENMETVVFAALMEDISLLLGNLIAKEKITIETDFQAGTLFTVRSYMHSIFINLITNSIRYRNTAVNTVIRIATWHQNNILHISFSDNGLGIDLSTHGDKIFGLYKKFHAHTEGKGMGLYMVKTQVEMLGGKISIHSKVNEGTEFILQFKTQSG